MYLMLLYTAVTLFSNVDSLLDARLIADYAKHKNLQLVTVYSCFVSKKGKNNCIMSVPICLLISIPKNNFSTDRTA